MPVLERNEDIRPGTNGPGVENENGPLLLQLSMTHNLVITNTIFRQSTATYEGTWMQP